MSNVPDDDRPIKVGDGSAPQQGNPSLPSSTPNPFDPDRLRLRQDFDQLAAVKRVLTVVPVRKPHRLEFVRVHPEMQLPNAVVLETPGDSETYLVAPGLYDHVKDVVKVKALFIAITRDGVVFVWPVGMPGPDGRTNRWNDSAMDAALRARKSWLRVSANLELGAYAVFMPVAELPEPTWPDASLKQLLELAFRDRFIDSMDHPVLRKLRGAV